MFRYYIFDPFEGRPVGTNSTEVAYEFAAAEDFFVVDTNTNRWLDMEGSVEVQEAEH